MCVMDKCYSRDVFSAALILGNNRGRAKKTLKGRNKKVFGFLRLQFDITASSDSIRGGYPVKVAMP